MKRIKPTPKKNTSFQKKRYHRQQRKVIPVLLFLLAMPFLAMAQNIMVKGKVTTTSGEPLPGVNIIVVGTTQGTITDIDGNYSLEVPGNTKLKFNFIGFTPKEIQINNRKIINVILKEDIQSLEEVVVVGYGQMKRSDLTGSVVSVSSDAVEKSVTTSIDQVLQGRAAGVQIQQNSGAPGASSSIRIRGINSLNASNEPIFVVDGVIIDGSSNSNTDNVLSSINPADIVSMDILKDASATAIYGSRAANGVIIITTKKGKAGMASISYNGYIGWQQMPKKLDLLNLREYATLKNERAALGLVNYDDNFVRPDLLGEGTDWQDELFTNAMMHSNNLSISGGNEKNTYALGIGYLDQEGIAIGSNFDRFNLRGSFDSKIRKFFKVGASFAFHNSKQKTTVSDESLIKVALKQTPNVAVRNADGSFDGPDTDQYVQTNPVAMAMLVDNRNEKMGIRGNTYAEITPFKGLTFKTEYSFDYGVTNTYKFTPSYKFGAITNDTRKGERSKSYSKYWAWRNVLTYNNTFADIHNVTFMLGQEMQESYWDYLYGSRTGYLTNGATDLDLGDETTATNSNSSGESSLSSFFGRLFYSYNDKYLLTATLRYDGSSKFAKDNRWGWFPSAALAWKISNEDFFNSSVINNLKLRLGWGAVGNQNVEENAYTSTYKASGSNWGTGLLSSNIANKDLTWETTYSYNAGLDINLFDNRIEFIADLYYKKTEDLLLKLPLPAYVGTNEDLNGSFSAPWVNIGSLENKGVEFTLNTVNVDKGGFQWRSSFVFSLNRNKVLSLNTDSGTLEEDITEGSKSTIVTQTSVDEPIGQFYGYEVIGRFEKATDFYYKDEEGNICEVALPKGETIDEGSVWIGDYIFKDKNEDGIIDEKDRSYIGNPEPKFTYGISNTFTYKGFDLTIGLSGSYGNKVVNYQRRWLDDPSQNTNVLETALDYAHLGLIDKDGPDDDFRNIEIKSGDPYMPRLSSTASESNFRYSDRFVEDGSYLRIQNISFGYNLPRKWIQRFSLQSVKIYTNLQNVYTFTEYSGYDPEVGAMNQNVLLTGIDNARYPSPRIYTFGLNVTF